MVAPPFERFYSGGENDLRGFDIRSISPVAFLPDLARITLTNPVSLTNGSITFAGSQNLTFSGPVSLTAVNTLTMTSFRELSPG